MLSSWALVDEEQCRAVDIAIGPGMMKRIAGRSAVSIFSAPTAEGRGRKYLIAK